MKIKNRFFQYFFKIQNNIFQDLKNNKKDCEYGKIKRKT